MAYFGANHQGDSEDDPWDFLDAAPAIPPPLPLTETDSDEDKMSVKSAPAAPAKGAAKRKPRVSQQKDLLNDVCGLKKAIRMYPSEEGTLKETGVPPELQVKREHQTTHAGGSVYLCPHDKCQVPPFYAQSLSGIYSHIRRKHLGIALACPYCQNKVYWNSKGWNSHMNSKHKKVPHFGTALADEASMAQEMLKSAERHAAEPSEASVKRPKKKKKPLKPSKKRVRPESSSSSSSPDEGTSDSSTDDSSSSSSSDSEVTDSTHAPAPKVKKGKAKSSVASSTPEAADVATALVLAGTLPAVKQELDPSLDDMPELEAMPPPSFPEWARTPAKKRKKEDPN